MAGIYSCILWNAKCFRLIVMENHLVWFEYADLENQLTLALPTPVLANVRCMNIDQRCSLPHGDEPTIVFVMVNMKNHIFPLISTIILPNVSACVTRHSLKCCQCTIIMVFVVNFDALAQASDIQIERRQVVFLCWMQDLNPGSQTPNRQQTECSLTNRLSYRGSS